MTLLQLVISLEGLKSRMHTDGFRDTIHYRTAALRHTGLMVSESISVHFLGRDDPTRGQEEEIANIAGHTKLVLRNERPLFPHARRIRSGRSAFFAGAHEGGPF